MELKHIYEEMVQYLKDATPEQLSADINMLKSLVPKNKYERKLDTEEILASEFSDMLMSKLPLVNCGHEDCQWVRCMHRIIYGGTCDKYKKSE